MDRAINKIPKFDVNGNLPPGVYVVTLDQIRKQFTWNIRRRKLFDGLVKAIENLRKAGVKQLYIDGSFTTTKARPNDIDGCWVGGDEFNENLLDPVFKNRKYPRAEMKRKYGMDFLVAGIIVGSIEGDLVTAEKWFQFDRDENPKGILLLELQKNR